MSLPVSWHFVWQDQGAAVALSPVYSLCNSWEVWTSGRWNKKRKALCVLGGVVSALIGNVLLTGAAEQVYSSCDIAVTFIQSAPAAASPQEAARAHMGGRRPTGRRARPCLSWQTPPLSGNFCCLCRKAGGGGDSGGRMGFFHLSSLSGNTFSCFFPLRLQTKALR